MPCGGSRKVSLHGARHSKRSVVSHDTALSETDQPELRIIGVTKQVSRSTAYNYTALYRHSAHIMNII